MVQKKHLVLSAVNFTEGGPLTVLRDCLSEAKKILLPDWKITVLVHDTKLIDVAGVNAIAFPEVKKKWSRRLIFEWFFLNKFSKDMNVDLWISLHDITPRVHAKKSVVYCHNPTPFYKLRLQDFIHSRVLVAQRLFYGYLYGINIRRNDFVVVQQDWLRRAFQERYGVHNVIVAYPHSKHVIGETTSREVTDNKVKKFFFPALPRTFKNLDILFEACSILQLRNINNFEINLTTTEDENHYINSLYRKYPKLTCIKFLGRLSFDHVMEQYNKSDALLFPSKLETWGLPISEAKSLGLPIICVDLPYARETSGNYNNVQFCNADNAADWVEKMLSIIENNWIPLSVRQEKPETPFFDGWSGLLKFLVK